MKRKWKPEKCPYREIKHLADLARDEGIESVPMDDRPGIQWRKVTDVEDMAVGCCGLLTEGEAVARVVGLFVTPALRSMGMGSALLNKTVGSTRLDTVQIVQAYIPHGATKMFEAAGFGIVRRGRHATFCQIKK